jgi:hypothetical protein
MGILILLILVLLVLLYPFLWLIYQLRRNYRLRSRGFWVHRKGRDDIEYEERRADGLHRLTIHGELMSYGPFVVHVPTEEEWANEMPEWAQEHRAEILENVKRALGTKNYEYASS